MGQLCSTGMQCYVTPTVKGKPVMSGKKQVWQSDSGLSHAHSLGSFSCVSHENLELGSNVNYG